MVAHQASTLESGMSITLVDADLILANNSHFPSELRMAAEKLYGWLLVMI
jgi:hypothetical protein